MHKISKRELDRHDPYIDDTCSVSMGSRIRAFERWQVWGELVSSARGQRAADRNYSSIGASHANRMNVSVLRGDHTILWYSQALT